jgi:hypothetical protein
MLKLTMCFLFLLTSTGALSAVDCSKLKNRITTLESRQTGSGVGFGATRLKRLQNKYQSQCLGGVQPASQERRQKPQGRRKKFNR